MKPYIVTIATSHHPILLTLYASSRKDAIEYAKRTHRARFLNGEYKKITGAKRAAG